MGEEEAKKQEEATPDKKEEEKKPEKAADEEKKGEKKAEESKDPPPPPPPPPEIVLKVYMHCEGCARKVRRCLKGFDGVEEVTTDCTTHKVVVKGEKADPLKVLERVQKKSHRQVELLSPIPKPPAPEEKKPEEKEPPKPQEKKEELITVVLSVNMHCEACAQESKKRILRMKGVESAEPDLKSSEVTVKGVFEPPKLVEYVYKRTGKHAAIVKQEPAKKEEEKPKDAKEEKKADEGGGGGGDKKSEGESKEKKEGDAAEAEAEAEATAENKVREMMNEYYYYSQFYSAPRNVPMDVYAPPPAYNYNQPLVATAAYPPQIFSDENPNACSVM
ncbi:heavy metal-associated isoprenylated plant protein 7-like [Syzygium oleosum]|uniref:heavy metal-associated isoprenylated plant protein 7-like n=1 Tax=Syzygium oleosum TaxID=219896 RepID=UPI0024BB6290|nr:heavy metal-associated isoprenylated plant protein 7-like [Syzygium oleosum]